MVRVQEKRKEITIERVSYALFFASCVTFFALQLISFVVKSFGGKNASNDIIFAISAFFGLIGVALKISTVFVNKKLKKPKIKGKFSENLEIFLLVFAFFWTLLATIFAVKQDVVWLGNSYNKEGFLSIVGYGVIGISAYMMRKEDRKRLLKLAVIFSTIPATYLIFVNIFSLKAFIPPTRSIYLNSNHYGYALSVLTVISAGLVLFGDKKTDKIIFSFCFAILNANLLVTDCFGAHVGEIVGLIALIVIKIVDTKKLPIVVLVIVAIMAVTTVSLEVTKITNITDDYKALFTDVKDITGGEATGAEGSQRVGLWEETLKTIGKAPIFGKGLDCYYKNNVYADIDMPHNEYLQIASNAGIPTLVFYLGAIVTIYVKAIKRRKELKGEQKVALGAGLAYLVSAFFGNTFLYTYPLLVITMAFGMKKEKDA